MAVATERWTHAQIANLKKIQAVFGDSLPVTQLECVLGHSPAAIRRKCDELGVSSHPSSPGGHRARGGHRDDLGLYMRSGWEANYARYLRWLTEHRNIAGWEHEPTEFEFPVKRGNRFYIPDFRVTRLNGDVEWHEVKGWMDPDSRTKLKRFARHYPNEHLVLIDAAAYRALAAAVSGLIEGWE